MSKSRYTDQTGNRLKAEGQAGNIFFGETLKILDIQVDHIQRRRYSLLTWKSSKTTQLVGGGDGR